VLIYTHFEKKKDQEDKRHEVANAKGTIQSVAAQYNVSVSSVATWRKKYRTTE
jgi:transposase